MARYDDDDWVGTPPEGRHSRDMAKPEHWRRNSFAYQLFFGVLGVLLVVVVVIAVLSS